MRQGRHMSQIGILGVMLSLTSGLFMFPCLRILYRSSGVFNRHPTATRQPLRPAAGWFFSILLLLLVTGLLAMSKSATQF